MPQKCKAIHAQVENQSIIAVVSNYERAIGLADFTLSE